MARFDVIDLPPLLVPRPAEGKPARWRFGLDVAAEGESVTVITDPFGGVERLTVRTPGQPDLVSERTYSQRVAEPVFTIDDIKGAMETLRAESGWSGVYASDLGQEPMSGESRRSVFRGPSLIYGVEVDGVRILTDAPRIGIQSPDGGMTEYALGSPGTSANAYRDAVVWALRAIQPVIRKGGATLSPIPARARRQQWHGVRAAFDVTVTALGTRERWTVALAAPVSAAELRERVRETQETYERPLARLVEAGG